VAGVRVHGAAVAVRGVPIELEHALAGFGGGVVVGGLAVDGDVDAVDDVGMAGHVADGFDGHVDCA